MILTLRMTAEHEGHPEERRLEHGTLTIGRGTDNDWVLSDAERTLSKVHCRIDQSGDGFLLTDLSTNGVFLNDETLPVGRGRARSLSDGDVIVLGPFHIALAMAPNSPAGADADLPALPRPEASGPATPFTGIQHTPGSPIVPAAEPWLEQIPGGDFGPDRHVLTQGWDAPIDPAAFSAHEAREADHPPDLPVPFSQESEHASAISTVMRVPAAQSVLPTDWNEADPLAGIELAPSPFDLPPPRLGAPQTSRSPDPADIPIPNEELLAASVPAGAVIERVEPDLRPAGSGAPAPTIPKPSGTRTPPPAPVQTPTPAQDSGLPAATASVPFISRLLAQPEPDAAPGLVTDAAMPPLPPAAPSAVMDAFLEAAGLPADTLGGMSAEDAARDLGRLVRAAVEGSREILATRAMVKAELRVDQTIIQATANNPMKFAPDVQRCLAAMVGQPPPGFLPGSAAMAQSLDDVKRHELALVAALNGVFGNLTEKLDPEAIAAKVRAESGLNTILPYAREARCWAVYVEQYQALQSTDAENTGGSLLAPLASAYARQLRRVE